VNITKIGMHGLAKYSLNVYHQRWLKGGNVC